MRLLILLCFLFVSAGCTSAMKRLCENTNWYEHGKRVAMSGKRINADNFIKQCEKEEVIVDFSQVDLGFKAGMGKYCLPETVYLTGKSGKEFNPELCDGSPIAKLKAKHKEGVAVYCKPENAKRLGSSGKGYSKICPDSLESAFIKSYSLGRMKYLRELSRQKEKEIKLARRQERSYQSDLTKKEKQLSGLPFVSEPKKDNKGKVINPLTNEQRAILEKRKALSADISKLEKKVESSRRKQSSLRQQISQHKAEAVALKSEANAK